MPKRCRVTKVKVLFLFLVLAFNFNLLEFSAAVLVKGLLEHTTEISLLGLDFNQVFYIWSGSSGQVLSSQSVNVQFLYLVTCAFTKTTY